MQMGADPAHKYFSRLSCACSLKNTKHGWLRGVTMIKINPGCSFSGLVQPVSGSDASILWFRSRAVFDIPE